MNGKAFTLIELLAVIVILAIIALIAVPIVLSIINDSKKESLQRSVDLYIDTVQKRITQENMKTKYDPEKCIIQANGNVKCYREENIIKTATGEDELKIEMNGKKPEAGIITFKTQSTNTDSNKITYTGVVLEGMEYELREDGKVVSKAYVPSKPATGEDYRGYYADVDGNGTVDGIIYADLAHQRNGTWGPGYNEEYISCGIYSYTAKTNFKKYTISKNKYIGNFGEKEIISVKSGTSGNSRFYVISLADFITEAYEDSNDSNNNYPSYTTYYWYKNASYKMSTYATDTKTDFGEGYTNTRKIIEIWNKNGTGEGSYTGATQDKQDIWKHIQSKYQDGWYIPSRGEWAAFADYFEATSDYDMGFYLENGGNYNSEFGLSNAYLSSSQYDTGNVWRMNFEYGFMDYVTVYNEYSHVRFGTTF